MKFLVVEDINNEIKKIVSGSTDSPKLHGVIMVEYERDNNGNIIRNNDGTPRIASDINGNPKIGVFLPEWNPTAIEKGGNVFGAWVASGGSQGSLFLIMPHGHTGLFGYLTALGGDGA
ncbi:hypothetical protein J7M23_09570 [Candidatus Sumerlaeota bacterium]|nr:hypothetical protein [Candidatus Sumerlaeota bacterium]